MAVYTNIQNEHNNYEDHVIFKIIYIKEDIIVPAYKKTYEYYKKKSKENGDEFNKMESFDDELNRSLQIRYRKNVDKDIKSGFCWWLITLKKRMEKNIKQIIDATMSNETDIICAFRFSRSSKSSEKSEKKKWLKEKMKVYHKLYFYTNIEMEKKVINPNNYWIFIFRSKKILENQVYNSSLGEKWKKRIDTQLIFDDLKPRKKTK